MIGDPSLALLLLMIGFYGLLFEFASPGYVLPGVVGAVCLLLGLFGLQTLPVNYAGLALVILGMAFFVAEAFVPSYGSLGLGGVVAFALGAVMLFDDDMPGFGVSRPLIADAVGRVVAVRARHGAAGGTHAQAAVGEWGVHAGRRDRRGGVRRGRWWRRRLGPGARRTLAGARREPAARLASACA